jgi:hypothetical protein
MKSAGWKRSKGQRADFHRRRRKNAGWNARCGRINVGCDGVAADMTAAASG